jgi:small conductance mechanosensitive channel
MEILNQFVATLKDLGPMIVTIVGVVVALLVARRLIGQQSSSHPGRLVKRQVMTLVGSLVGLLLVILVMPISDSVQGQLLSLMGILLSAVLALSATTLVGNVLAGLMLRALHNFQPGSFIRVGEHFGRVTEQGLFHVEIQTEERDLTTLPNLHLVTNPLKVIRPSGTIVSAEVSLGYDVPHSRVKELLLQAGTDAKLDDPFVHVVNLGDFSVTYRLAGMLVEVRRLLSTRSRLREKMLDSLHSGGVEIVSPTYMNTLARPTGEKAIPPTEPQPADDTSGPKLESMAFDKADLAESLEKLRQWHDSLDEGIKSAEKELGQAVADAERTNLKARIESLKAQKNRLTDLIERRESEQES